METPTESFPAVDVDKDLNPDHNDSLVVDPVSSQLAQSIENKEQSEADKKQKEKERNDALQTFKSTIIVSGVLIAVAGAIFAISKKLRENK